MRKGEEGGEGRGGEAFRDQEEHHLGPNPPLPQCPQPSASQGQVLLEFSSGPVSSPCSHPGNLCAILPLLPQSTPLTPTFEGYPWDEAQTPGCPSHRL